jgi:hypothetical protein
MGRGVDWFDLAQGRWLAGSFEHGDEPSGSKTRAELLGLSQEQDGLCSLEVDG